MMGYFIKLALSNILTTIGIKIICNIIPGIALVKAPAINTDNEKPLLIPRINVLASPQTSLPNTIETINETMILWFILRYKYPETKPYVASSNAIQIAFNIIGIPNKKLRNTGVINPIIKL
jgi:hypothetical protein